MKRLLSVLVSIVIIVSASVLPFEALAKQNDIPDVIISSLMGKGALLPMFKSGVTSSSKSYSYDGEKYYSAGKELYTEIKNHLVKRNTSFSVNYLTSSKISDLLTTASNLIISAVSDELSTSAVDGDYAYRSIYGLNGTSNYSVSDGKYCYTIDYKIVYNDSAEEEKQVDEVVKNFISSTNTSKMSDYEIIRTIHDFICERTEYDYRAANASIFSVQRYLYAYSAYGTLVKGKSVCQGYALAFYRLCKELGYNCRFVASDPREGCHAWNIVELNGKYYFVDCTWDDEAENYDLFLVDYDGIRSLDDSYYKQHTLYDAQYGDKYFYDNYQAHFSTSNYDSTDDSLLSNCVVSLSSNRLSYTGNYARPSVMVTAPDGKNVSTENYSLSYRNTKNAGNATITLNGKNKYTGSSSHRCYVIVPEKAGTPAVKSGTRSSKQLTLIWKKSDCGSTGYTVYQLKNGKWQSVKSTSSTQTVINSLSPNSIYSFRIREYKKINNRLIYGDYSYTLTTGTKPNKVNIRSLTSSKGSTVISWSTTDCGGYQLQYSTNSSMKNAKSININNSTASKKLTSLKKSKKYYFRIRTVNKRKAASGKTYCYYSEWSAKKYITVR